MNANKAGELVVFIFSISLLILYNFLYFTKWFQRFKIKFHNRRYLNLWNVGSEARAVWAGAMMADPKEGVTAAQGIRNMVMGVSILAAGVTLLTGQLLILLTDPARLDQVAKYSRDDPISGGNELMSPQSKIGISLGVLVLALVGMTQCVRLSVHLTYILRAASADPQRQRRFQRLAFAVNRRASFFFSVGLRVQYAFFPVFLYILGPLALLISTVVEVLALLIMDLTPDREEYQDENLDVEEGVENAIVETGKPNQER